MLRPLTTGTFFESFPKETQKSWILRIRIRINPLNLHRVRIYWIHNPFLDFAKETKNPFLDSESGLGFFPKKCTQGALEQSLGAFEQSLGALEESLGALEQSLGAFEQSLDAFEQSLGDLKNI